MVERRWTEWKEWQGGECPLHHGTRFQARMEDGTIEGDSDPESWTWEHTKGAVKITAYRIALDEANFADALNHFNDEH